MIFAANTPVAKTTKSVSSTPRPGMCTPSQDSVRNPSGSNNNERSMAPTKRSRTHNVITSGTQMRRPATKCRLMELFFMSVQSPAALVSVLEVSLPEAALLDDSLAAVSLAAPSLPDPSSDFFFSAGFAPLFLKSVAYQPVPFNWKPAALTSFCNALLPHLGHSVGGASFTRCRNSF